MFLDLPLPLPHASSAIAVEDKMDEAFTYQRASRAAKDITRYWVARGYHGIKALVVRGVDEDFTVKSNIGPSGFPPKF